MQCYKNSSVQGFGDVDYSLAVYIENRPPMPEFQRLDSLVAIEDGKLARIVKATGNHWRKIFNVYAKIIFDFEKPEFDRWQSYRDQKLLQPGSRVSLLFSGLSLKEKQDKSIALVCGKTYAQKLGLLEYAVQIESDFFIIENKKIIITPYFDYRQLSNKKITILVDLLHSLG